MYSNLCTVKLTMVRTDSKKYISTLILRQLCLTNEFYSQYTTILEMHLLMDSLIGVHRDSVSIVAIADNLDEVLRYLAFKFTLNKL